MNPLRHFTRQSLYYWRRQKILPSKRFLSLPEMPRGSRSEGDQQLVRISRALSSTLRHNAASEGLKLQADGYANVAELVTYSFKLLE
jgi:hypothetical protein